MFTGIEQIDKFIMPVPHCGCWLWIGNVNSRGYGTIKYKGVSHYVHRLVWSKHHKRPIPKGMVLLHSCDTPRCCNPLHTSPGSHRKNMRDMVKKGRAASRSNGRHRTCKLGFRIARGFDMEAT